MDRDDIWYNVLVKKYGLWYNILVKKYGLEDGTMDKSVCIMPLCDEKMCVV